MTSSEEAIRLALVWGAIGRIIESRIETREVFEGCIVPISSARTWYVDALMESAGLRPGDRKEAINTANAAYRRVLTRAEEELIARTAREKAQLPRWRNAIFADSREARKQVHSRVINSPLDPRAAQEIQNALLQALPDLLEPILCHRHIACSPAQENAHPLSAAPDPDDFPRILGPARNHLLTLRKDFISRYNTPPRSLLIGEKYLVALQRECGPSELFAHKRYGYPTVLTFAGIRVHVVPHMRGGPLMLGEELK